MLTHRKPQRQDLTNSSFTILQINLRHSKAASALLVKTIEDYNIDIVMIQEPYALKRNQKIRIANVPNGYVAHHCLSEDHQYGAAIIIRRTMKSRILTMSNNCAVYLNLSAGTSTLLLISAYCRPSSNSVCSVLSPGLNSFSSTLKNSIVCIDSNAKNPLWNSRVLDKKGRELEHLINQHSLYIVNTPKEKLSFLPTGSSFLDVTLAGDNIKLKNWRFLPDPSLSDHPYIIFEVPSTRVKSHGPPKKVPKLDK